MKRLITKYHDSKKLLHDDPAARDDVLTSENSPLYCGIEAQLYDEHGEFDAEMSREYLTDVIPEYYNEKGYWVASSGSDNDDFSRDNFSGLIAMVKLCAKYKENKQAVRRVKKLIPLFHKQLDHPRDFVLVGYFKYPYLFWPLLPVVTGAFALTCAQRYKVRNGNKIVKTDGKLIAFMLCHVFKLRLTYWLCMKVLPLSGFKSRTAVSMTYFRNLDHIINEKYAGLEK